MEVGTMSSGMISFEKLTETDHQRWSIQMKSTLQRDGVWRIVEGKEVDVMAVVILKTSEYTKANRCGVENMSRETKIIE